MRYVAIWRTADVSGVQVLLQWIVYFELLFACTGRYLAFHEFVKSIRTIFAIFIGKTEKDGIFCVQLK